MHVEEVLTKSAPTEKPSWICDDDEQQEQMEKHATIEEPCPKSMEMWESGTVFLHERCNFVQSMKVQLSFMNVQSVVTSTRSIIELY